MASSIRTLFVAALIVSCGAGSAYAKDDDLRFDPVADAPRPRQAPSRSGYRIGGVTVLTLGAGAMIAALATLPLAYGNCSGNGQCSGGNFGWSMGTAIAAAALLPIGIALTVHGYREPILRVGPAPIPGGGALLVTSAF